MRASLVAVVVSFLCLVPTALMAGTRSCTTSMVTLNICRSTSDVAYCLAIGTVDPDAGGPLLPPSTTIADAFAALYNYQSPSVCTQDMVAAGVCTAPQIGTSVTVTKAQFADMQVRLFIKGVILRYRKQQSIDAASVAADAQPDPDIGN